MWDITRVAKNGPGPGRVGPFQFKPGVYLIITIDKKKKLIIFEKKDYFLFEKEIFFLFFSAILK